MNRLYIIFFSLLVSLSAVAQETLEAQTTQNPQQSTPYAFQFGYFSFDEVFRSSGEYAIAQRSLSDLRAKYAAEQKRAEDEFNKKYEEFLDEQSSFAPNIREKRQAELEEIMKKNMAFRQESERLLKEAEASALNPLRERITSAAQRIGTESGYAFILNTDNNAVPFISINYGVDITAQLKKMFQ